jgi:hypothetical protein
MRDMYGLGLINLKIDQHSYYEHQSLVDAKAEAHRLARTLNGRIVIYAPIFVIEPPKPQTEARLDLPRDVRELFTDDDLPF